MAHLPTVVREPLQASPNGAGSSGTSGGAGNTRGGSSELRGGGAPASAAAAVALRLSAWDLIFRTSTSSMVLRRRLFSIIRRLLRSVFLILLLSARFCWFKAARSARTSAMLAARGSCFPRVVPTRRMMSRRGSSAGAVAPQAVLGMVSRG